MTIAITVTGHTASGKSAIAELIRSTLAKNGIEVTLEDDNGCGVVDELPWVIANSLDARLGSFRNKGEGVKIRTIQARRGEVL